MRNEDWSKANEQAGQGSTPEGAGLTKSAGREFAESGQDGATENADVSRLIGGLKPHGSVAQRKRYGFKGSDVSAMRPRLSVGRACIRVSESGKE